MTFSRLWCGLACCIVFCTSAAHAQEDVLRPNGRSGGTGSGSSSRSSSALPIFIGVDGGINYNIFSADVDGYPQTAVYKPFESASGISPFFDAYIDFGVARSIGIQLKLSYDIKNVSNDRSTTDTLEGYFYFEDEPLPIYSPGEEITYSQDLEIKTAYLGIAPLLRVNLTDNLLLTVGPSIQIPLGDIEQTDKLAVTDSPDGFNPFFYDGNGDGLPDDVNGDGSFADDYFASGTLTSTADNPQSPRIAIELGLAYRIPLTPSIALLPRAGFQYFVSPLVQKEDSEFIGVDGEEHDLKPTIHSAQFSIGLLFGL